MKVTITTPLPIKQVITGFKCLVAMFFITATCNAQVNTFTATNMKVMDTLTNLNVIKAQAITANDTIRAKDHVVVEQDLQVLGNIILSGDITAPLNSTATIGSLINNGPAIFNANLKLAPFAGTGERIIYADANGNLKAGPPGGGPYNGITGPCVINASPWFVGGDLVGGASDIGTCNAFDFILKSNNIQRQWIKTDGKIGFGIQNPGSLAGPEYQFHQGALRLSGANSFGGPQLIFDGGSPNGDWGIEYINAASSQFPGINFWKPSGSANSFNYLFFIGDDGRMTVGDVNEAASARFNVDGWNGNGIRAKVNASVKAYSVLNKNTSVENFVVYGDGRTRINGSSPTIETNLNPELYIKVDNTSNSSNIKAGLVVDTKNMYYAGNGTGGYYNYGVLVNMDNNSPAFAVVDNNALITSPNKHTFLVQGDGQTFIGTPFPTSTAYMLTVNGRVGAREIKVSIQNPWPDYVFANGFKLASLETTEKYLKENKHLPNIPSAEELKKEELGLDLAQMQGLQMEKIEEIYLHLIALNKQVKELKKENQELKQQLKK